MIDVRVHTFSLNCLNGLGAVTDKGYSIKIKIRSLTSRGLEEEAQICFHVFVLRAAAENE